MSIKDWQIDQSWTLFLDRDGVINERNFNGYIVTPNEFKFIDKVPESIALLSSVFQRIIVVTNQQGVAKGLMTERNLLVIHNFMFRRIRETGGRIDDCFYATNLKGDENDIRKPKPDMAYLAKVTYPEIDFKKSIMIGDTDSDILFGKQIGMKTVLVQSNEKISVSADLIVKDLYDFAKQVTQ